MKHIIQMTNSILESSPNSTNNYCSNSTTQSSNQIAGYDLGRSRGSLNSSFGSSPNGQDSVTQLDPDREGYHLPRSSPVILGRSHFKEEVQSGQSMEQSTACPQSLTPPALKTCATPTIKVFLGSKNLLELPEKKEPAFLSSGMARLFLHSLPLALHCGPDDHSKKTVEQYHSGQVVELPHIDKQKKLSQNTLFHANKPRGLSPSEPLNGFSDKKAGAGSDACLILGSRNEEQITGDLYRNSMDIDQENAHFAVVDMVLEVIEALKWTTDHCFHRFSSSRSSQSAVHSSQRGPSCSAEDLARQLLSKFRKTLAHSEKPLCCYNQCLTLVKFPIDTALVMMRDGVRLSEEITQRSRMRGTLSWAPPRFQIIFSMHPIQRRSDVIASQHFLCAGCGTEIERRYIKKLRYCNYLGRYFCNGCHAGSESVIPGRVLSRWDFSRYPVCLFSKQLLNTIWEQPLFKLTSVAKDLYSQAKELQRFRELQEKMISIKKLLKACRLSDGALAEFQQVPTHLTEEPHLFSMNDLIRVKRGQLVIKAKTLLQVAMTHVESCELCQAKGFICEFCRGQEVLFPFMTDICTRCPDCRACFHTACFRDEPCPKCERLQSRKSLQDTPLGLQGNHIFS